MKPNKNTKKKQAALVTTIDKSKKKVEVKNAVVAGKSTDAQVKSPGLSAAEKTKKKLRKPKSKPTADVKEQKEELKMKKRKAEPEKKSEDQSMEDNEELVEDESDIESSENDGDSDHQQDLMNDDGEEILDFEFEAFPMEEDDKEGIVNMLTQTFLRSPIDTVGLADAIIKSSPFGTVIGPAENDDDDETEEKENVVYGVLSAAELDPTKDDTPKYVSDVIELITTKANKYAVKNVGRTIQEHLKSRVGMLISERMLNFPVLVVPPIYKSFRKELTAMKKKYQYQHVLYIYKIRVADEEKPSVSAPVPSATGPPKKKKKMGKAEKKRLAAQSLETADIIYDNPEDAELLKLTDGVAHHFDYPVYHDVEVGSKFHTTRKNDKTYKPFRRVVLMDAARFNAFVQKLCSL